MNLKDILEEVEDGGFKRMDCPKCRSSNSLTISHKDGEYVFNCFDASCTLRGRVPSIPSVTTLRHRLASRNALQSHTEEERPFELPPYLVMGISSERCLQLLLKTNSLDAYRKGMYRTAYDPKEDRLVYLIYENNKIVGAVGRTLTNQKPKTKVYPNSKPIPFIVGKGSNLVITEDIASACAVASFHEFSGSPMLGSSLKDDYIHYYSGYDCLIVAYDPDARKKALKLKQYLTYHHKCVNIWNIPKDIKDMSKDELRDFINERS